MNSSPTNTSEATLMDKTPFSLVVADIHLQTQADHPINQNFLSFLQQQAVFAERLYILGDLFEMWVGDDIGLPEYAVIIQALRNLSNQGVEIFIQYGNRDFLMRQQFSAATGCKLMTDIEVHNLYSKPYLMLHGDSLCTEDHDYQKMKKWLRNPVIQWLFLHLPQSKRLQIGAKMRSSSKQSSAQKNQQIMDVTPSAVTALFQQYPQVSHMIHGHTHRPQKHELFIDGKTKFRWVLGDWRPEAKIIKISADGIGFLDIAN